MVNRIRVRNSWWGTGYAERKIGTAIPVRTTDTQLDSLTESRTRDYCEDVAGQPNVDHPLIITHRDKRLHPPLNGRVQGTGGSYSEYSNYLGSAQKAPDSHLVPFSGLPSIGASATTLMARTNPNREAVSVPVFIGELRDLPGMYRDLVGLKLKLRNLASLRGSRGTLFGAARDIPKHYLGYEFGWRPLISDLRKMLTFQDLVDKRIVELNRLYSSRGLKRRLRLGTWAIDESSSVALDTSIGLALSVRKHKFTKIERWGTCRWVPTSVPHDLKRQDLGKLARKLVFGLGHNGLDAGQAWNLVPWTWLIDWFANFGEYLDAHRNDVPVELDGPCNIMTRRTTMETWRRTDLFTQISGGEGLRSLVSLERAQSTDRCRLASLLFRDANGRSPPLCSPSATSGCG